MVHFVLILILILMLMLMLILILILILKFKLIAICVKRFHVTGTHMAVLNFEIVSVNITYLKSILKRLIHINYYYAVTLLIFFVNSLRKGKAMANYP
jgi:hypothetical protein